MESIDVGERCDGEGQSDIVSFFSFFDLEKKRNEREPMSSSLLSAALEDATRVVKKQRTTSSVTAEAIEAALRVLEEAQERCDDGATMTPTTTSGDANAILAAAAEALKGADASGIVAAATKDLHGAVGKLGKVRKKRERER